MVLVSMPLMKTFALAGTQMVNSPLLLRVLISIEVDLFSGLGGAVVGVSLLGADWIVVPPLG